MGPPVADIEAVRQGTRRVLRAVGDLTDEQAAAPVAAAGLVTGRGARRTWPATPTAGAASRSRPRAARSGRSTRAGAEQRAAGIAAGRGVGAAALLADLRRSCDALMEAWMQLPDDAWERVGRSLTGERTQREWVWSRWREVEVHHVDLGLGYAASEWPVAFVTRGLDDAFAELPGARRAGAARPPTRPFRLEATDHDRAWIVSTDGHGRAQRRARRPRDDVPVDGTVTGWGCDLLAWLYGRDPSGAGPHRERRPRPASASPNGSRSPDPANLRHDPAMSD